MIVVREQFTIHQIANTAIQQLVRQRIEDLGGDTFDADAIGLFIVVETTDTMEAIRAQVGFNILHNRFTGIRFDATGFTPSFEFIEEFPSCFDMVFVLDDSGSGIELFVPKEEGIDSELIAMCRRFAFSSPPEYDP